MDAMQALDIKEYTQYTTKDTIEVNGNVFVFDVLETDSCGGCWESTYYATKVELFTVNGETPAEEVSRKFSQLIEGRSITIYIGE